MTALKLGRIKQVREDHHLHTGIKQTILQALSLKHAIFTNPSLQIEVMLTLQLEDHLFAVDCLEQVKEYQVIWKKAYLLCCLGENIQAVRCQPSTKSIPEALYNIA